MFIKKVLNKDGGSGEYIFSNWNNVQVCFLAIRRKLGIFWAKTGDSCGITNAIWKMSRRCSLNQEMRRKMFALKVMKTVRHSRLQNLFMRISARVMWVHCCTQVQHWAAASNCFEIPIFPSKKNQNWFLFENNWAKKYFRTFRVHQVRWKNNWTENNF